MSGGEPSESLCVGLIKAQSPSLSKDGVFIAVLTKDSVLRFYGNLQVRVLGGVVKMESYIMKPSQSYVSVNVPVDRSSTAVSLEAMDPDSSDTDLKEMLLPFRGAELLHFHANNPSSKRPTCGKRGDQERRCVVLDLDKEDIRNLNSLVQSPPWDGVWAVALLKPLDSHLTEMLSHHGYTIHTSQQLRGFLVASSHQTVRITDTLRDAATQLLNYPAASVVISGWGGSGKSTLARYLINNLLNRCAVVGYLECDPGQCEFTCPEVLSLHLLTEPVFGPPYVHHRKPYKAYYFGDSTPRTDPEYYIRLLRTLHSSFHDEVRKSLPHIPLIVNTCGWLNDMGVQLFLDIVRSISPTHIIRLLPTQYTTVDTIRHLPPLTEEFFTSTPGLFTPADRGSGRSVDHPARPSFQSAFSGTVPVNTSPVEESRVEVHVEGGDSSSDVEMFGSSEDGFEVSDTGEESEEASPGAAKEKVCLKRKRKRLQMANARIKRRAMLNRRAVLESTDQWEQVLTYKVLQTKAGPRTKTKNSSQQRKLRLLAYLSSLLPVAVRVSREYTLPDPHQSLLLYVPPLAVPWRDIAIHTLHKVVSVDHLLYALNGRLVCLGHVDPEQIVAPESPDMFGVVKSSTPLVSYSGLGLVRGVDADRRILYLTTPLRLDRDEVQAVNVLVLGNPDSLTDIFKEHVPGGGAAPYKAGNFKHTELSKYQWNAK